MVSSALEADERAPLLANGNNGDSNSSSNNGTISSDSALSPSEATIKPPSKSSPITSAPSDEITTRQLIIIHTPIYLGVFLASIDSTLVATLSAPISTSFHSLTLLSWFISAYFIANAALQPISGKLTDIFGRQAGLVASNMLFGIGNLICGLAKDEWVMILGRVVAGMGGGGMHAISTFVGSDLIPLRRRGLWQGIGNLFYGVGAALGGVYGGWIDGWLGWRWAFFIQVPLTVISGIGVFFLVRIPTTKSSKGIWERIDFLGAGTLLVTLVALLLGLNSGGNILPWTHPLVLAALCLSIALFMAFLWIESRYAIEPVIPVKLLLDRTILSACLTNWFTTMAIFSVFFYGPIFFQVRGMTPTQAGERLIPQSLGVGIGSIGSGFMMRWLGRYYALNVVGQVILVLAFALIATTFDLDTPAAPPFIYFLMLGLSYASMLTITLLALIAAVDHEHQAVVTSASYAFRSTGSTIGVTIASAVFQNTLTKGLWDGLGDRKDANELIPRLRESLEEIQLLPPALKLQVQEIYVEACRGVFYTALGLGTAGALISLLMREHKLHTSLSRRDSETSRR
ncbi:hypothetical protein MMC25_007648 [Agyrium rufum]|nr:hypothetical protein [Agyrium rufum]